MAKKISYKEVRSEFENRGYKLLEETYVNAKTKMKFLCPHHLDKETFITYDSFKRGSGCRFCSIEKRSRKQALSYKDVETTFRKQGLILLPDQKYTNARTPLNFICENGHEGNTTVRSIREQGTGCRDCSNNRLSELYRLPYKKVKQEFEEFGYILTSEVYVNTEKNLNYICPNGHTGTMNLSNFRNGKRCSTCRQSKGEALIESILKEFDYTYMSQVRLEACKDKKPLPFDFGLYDNDTLICLIEYQGIQHYKPIDFAGKGKEWALEQFIGVQKRDVIKRDFCKKNNIPFIEIHYSLTETEVSEFLCNKLLELSKYKEENKTWYKSNSN